MKLKIIYIFLLWVIPFSQNLHAQVPHAPDSTQVEVRTADEETFRDLAGQNVFDYQQEAQNPETLWSRLRNWLFQVISYVFEHPWASVVIKVIFFAIFGLVLAALVNQLLGGKLSSGFSRSKPQDPFTLNIQNRSVFDQSYDTMLAKAIEDHQFRDAVRILYLMALKQLNDREMITWKPDKTNHDYLAELGDHPSSRSFDILTSYYEYVEYGDFKIEEAGYQSVHEVYKTFRNKVSS